eukprot:s784_g8.t1
MAAKLQCPGACGSSATNVNGSQRTQLSSEETCLKLVQNQVTISTSIQHIQCWVCGLPKGRPKRGMVLNWEKVNPDNAVDPLPLPFSIIDEVIEEILEAVGDEVDLIEKKKRCPEYEFALPEARASSFVQVPGRIACAYVEPRGTARMALGTSEGEALLVDTRKGEVVAHAHPFPELEPVTCVSICSESAYQDVFAGPGIDPPALPAPQMKLFAGGVTTPKILVYDIQKESFGVVLKPACAIHLPKPEAEETERPVIEQLHTRGVIGGVWVVALLPDKTVRVFLTPLGEPDLDEEANVVLDTPIAEGDEDDEEGEDEDGGPAEEFANALQVNTAMYSFSLTQLAPMRHLPMPELDTITLTVFSPRPRDGAYGVGVSAGQVPTLCFSSSVESNAILAHFIPSPAPLVAPTGLELDELLMKEIPPHGLLPDPENTKQLQPRRRWSMPAKTSAVAVAPNGGIFAVGGCQGSLAVIMEPVSGEDVMDLNKELFEKCSGNIGMYKLVESRIKRQEPTEEQALRALEEDGKKVFTEEEIKLQMGFAERKLKPLNQQQILDASEELWLKRLEGEGAHPGVAEALASQIKGMICSPVPKR